MASRGSIEIKDFQKGISDSYLGDFAEIRNIDVYSTAGVALINKKMAKTTPEPSTYSAQTFTADAGTDQLTISSHGFISSGHAVTVSSTGTLPTGLSASTTYYVIFIDQNTIKLASSLSNLNSLTPINITSAGTGTHSITGIEMKKVLKIVRNPKRSSANFEFFAVDALQNIWTNFSQTWTLVDGNTAGQGQGIEIWKDYLFSFINSTIEVFGPLSSITAGTAAWTTSWKSFNTGDALYHPSLIGQDDILYVGDGFNIMSLSEVTTFDPASAGTYSFNNNALDLPSQYRIKCLAELGKNLVMGTFVGSNEGTTNIADLFFWDRISDSFEFPIQVKEEGINAIISVENLIYFFAGFDGNVYVTNGVSVDLFKKIPDSLLDRQQTTEQIEVLPNAIIKVNGRIYFGLSNEQAGSSETLSPLGIYSLTPDGRLTLEHTISGGNDGSSGSVSFGALYSKSSKTIYAAYLDASQTPSESAIDLIETSKRYDESEAQILTGLIHVSDNAEEVTLEQTEIYLSKNISSGQSVTVSYRKNLSDSFTEIGSISFSNDGATSKKTIRKSIKVSEIQFKIVLDTGLDATDTPELTRVVLRK